MTIEAITKEICDKTRYLLAQSKAQTDNPAIQGALELALKTVRRSENMLPDSGRYMIAFAGLTNVGKSTFLNALLGESVAPVKNVPWSSAPVEYVYGNKIKSILRYPDDYRPQRCEHESPEDLLAFLESCATEGGHRKSNGQLSIELPVELLADNVTIVDTPGFGATDGSGSDVGLHDDILLDYISTKKDLHRIFLIVKGDVIDNSTIDFFKNHLAGKCTDLIVNMTSDMDDTDKERYEDRYLHNISEFMQVHYVNAKKALKGLKKNDEQMMEESGIEEIRDMIYSISNSKGRCRIIHEDLIMLYRDLSEHILLLNNNEAIWPASPLGMLKERVKMLDDVEFIDRFNEYMR